MRELRDRVGRSYRLELGGCRRSLGTKGKARLLAKIFKRSEEVSRDLSRRLKQAWKDFEVRGTQNDEEASFRMGKSRSGACARARRSDALRQNLKYYDQFWGLKKGHDSVKENIGIAKKAVVLCPNEFTCPVLNIYLSIGSTSDNNPGWARRRCRIHHNTADPCPDTTVKGLATEHPAETRQARGAKDGGSPGRPVAFGRAPGIEPLCSPPDCRFPH